jgi:N,N'-diacetyllegionaminate synthase
VNGSFVPEITIAGRPVGPAYAPFVIAEAGINHNGELEKALEMIHAAKSAGADAVKFQTFKAEEFVGDQRQTYTYLSQGREVTESMLEMFRRHELPREAWFEIKAECDRQGIVFLSTPQNRSDLDLLLEVGIPAVKVGSDDFTNLPLLKSYASTGLPLILSCGMADMAEVYRSLETVGAPDGYPTILLLCTSQYPTPPEDVNLRKLATLRAASPGVALGFSDHTQGPLASAIAVAFEACVFEKHFTLDRDLPGPDHCFSENPASLTEWVHSIHKAHLMLGSAIVRPTEREKANKKEFRRVIVASRDIQIGEIFDQSNLTMRRIRGGQGLPAQLFYYFEGKSARKAYKAGEPISI